MKTTTCDHCGQQIEDGGVYISVIDSSGIGSLRENLRKGVGPAKPMTTNLDLHAQCYIDHYQAALEVKP